MSEALAILGGDPVRKRPFPEYRTIGAEEKRAVMEVLDSGILSQFLGTWSPEFFGGPRVKRFEAEWSRYFGVRHAVTVNSATSGLYAAVGAAGVEPGDEVIVSPYTMAASATAAIIYGGIPVFADIDPDTFCISAKTIASRLSAKTKAIIVVDLLGYPVDIEPILKLARGRGIVVIEDAAQAPGARRHSTWAGTAADIGVFSLNYHKTIHTGEGGVVVTNDDRLAERVQLIRNHAEVVVREKGTEDLINMVGFNYRMTEIEAAIGFEQLQKLQDLIAVRTELADELTTAIRHYPGLTPPEFGPEIVHGYYMYGLRFHDDEHRVSRRTFASALRAEGIPVGEGYVRPLYLEPMYQRKIAFGRSGYPFNQRAPGSAWSYDMGICPVAEGMHFSELLTFSVCHKGVTREDIRDVARAIEKVVENEARLEGRED